MRRRPAIDALALLALFLAGSARADDAQWLRYRIDTDPSRWATGFTWRTVTAAPRAPAETTLPAFNSKQPLFVTWQTPLSPTGKVVLAFDRTRRYGPYNRLFADSDCDGHLDDENPITPPNSTSYQLDFGPVPIRFRGNDGTITYHLNLKLHTFGGPSQVQLMPGGWYEGNVTVGGKKHFCYLVDHNANGRFDDRSTEPGNADRIHMGNESAGVSRMLGDVIRVDGVYYDLSVAPDGAWIRVTGPAAVALGRLKLPDGVDEVRLGGERGEYVLKPEDGVAELPTGPYRLLGWKMSRVDEGGATWTLAGEMAPGDGGLVTVAAGRETSVAVGEPVRPTMTITRSGWKTFSIGHSITGNLGEAVTLQRNGRRPKAPGLYVENEAGTYSESYDFEYG